MSDDTPPLAFIGTDELIDELMSRSENAVVLCRAKADDARVIVRYGGDRFACIGMAHVLIQSLNSDIEDEDEED